MTNTRISAPVYERLRQRRDNLAEVRDRQVTITEVIEELLDAVDDADRAAVRARIASHTAPADVAEGVSA